MTFNFSQDIIRLNPGLKEDLGKAVPTASKYHNARTEAAGMTFQSGHEAAGVNDLILLEEQKQIFALRLQVRFPLPGGIAYIADAVYLDDRLMVHIVDFKGFKTPVYRIKKKLFRDRYGRDIEER
jgi:hypothetical protein